MMNTRGKRFRLAKVQVKEISLVDRGANQHSSVILSKLDEPAKAGGILFDDVLKIMNGPRLFNDIVSVSKSATQPQTFDQILKYWDDEDHPRDEDGKFTESSGSGRHASALIAGDVAGGYAGGKYGGKLGDKAGNHIAERLTTDLRNAIEAKDKAHVKLHQAKYRTQMELHLKGKPAAYAKSAEFKAMKSLARRQMNKAIAADKAATLAATTRLNARAAKFGSYVGTRGGVVVGAAVGGFLAHHAYKAVADALKPARRDEQIAKMHFAPEFDEFVVDVLKRTFDESKHRRAEDGRFTFKDGAELAARAARSYVEGFKTIGRKAMPFVESAHEAIRDAEKKVAGSVIGTAASFRPQRINPLKNNGGIQIELKGKDPTGRDIYVRHQIRPDDIWAANETPEAMEAASRKRLLLATVAEGLRMFGQAEVDQNERRTVIRRVKPGDAPDWAEGRAYDYAQAGVGEKPYRPIERDEYGNPVQRNEKGGVNKIQVAPNAHQAVSYYQNARDVKRHELKSDYEAALLWAGTNNLGSREIAQGKWVVAHDHPTGVRIPSGPSNWVSAVYRAIQRGAIPPDLDPGYRGSRGPKPQSEDRKYALKGMADRHTKEDVRLIGQFVGADPQRNKDPSDPRWNGGLRGPDMSEKGHRIPEGPADWQNAYRSFVDGRKGRDGDGDGRFNESGSSYSTSRGSEPTSYSGGGYEAPSSMTVYYQELAPHEQKHVDMAERIVREAHQSLHVKGQKPGSTTYEDALSAKIAYEINRAVNNAPSGSLDGEELHDYALAARNQTIHKSDNQPRDANGRWTSMAGAKSKMRRMAVDAVHRLGIKPGPGESKAAYVARVTAKVGAEGLVNLMSQGGMPDVAEHAGAIAEHITRHVAMLRGSIKKGGSSLPAALRDCCDHYLNSVGHAAGARYEAHRLRA